MNGTNNLAAINSTVNQIKSKAIDFAFDNGPKIITAIVILVVGFIITRWLANLVQRRLDKLQLEPPLKTLCVRVVRLLAMVFTILVAADKMGLPVTTAIAGISVAGVGVGLAMQGVLSNLVAGLVIIVSKPFRVGEFIELIGVQGQVKTIELFSTTLLHSDMSRVVIPNRKIVGEVLHNYGNIRQLDMSVGVGYASNVQDVLAVVNDILAKNPRVLQSPAPVVGVTTLADFSINVAVKPWTNLADYGPAQAEIYQTILDRFRQKNIEIPFPQREIRMLNGAQSVESLQR